MIFIVPSLVLRAYFGIYQMFCCSCTLQGNLGKDGEAVLGRLYTITDLLTAECLWKSFRVSPEFGFKILIQASRAPYSLIRQQYMFSSSKLELCRNKVWFCIFKMALILNLFHLSYLYIVSPFHFCACLHEYCVFTRSWCLCVPLRNGDVENCLCDISKCSCCKFYHLFYKHSCFVFSSNSVSLETEVKGPNYILTVSPSLPSQMCFLVSVLGT